MMKRIFTILLIVASGVACSQNPEPTKPDQAAPPAPVADHPVTPAIPTQTEPPKKPAHESARADISAALAKFAPGWMAKDCGAEASPGIRDALGKTNVLVTHPLSDESPCVIGRRMDILPGKKSTLHLEVGHHPEGNWLLMVTADHELVHKVIGKESAPDGWTTIDVDLSSYAGRIITLQLINAVNPGAGAAHQEAYWAKIEIN
jgi:hypothetical protein